MKPLSGASRNSFNTVSVVGSVVHVFPAVNRVGSLIRRLIASLTGVSGMQADPEHASRSGVLQTGSIADVGGVYVGYDKTEQTRLEGVTGTHGLFLNLTFPLELVSYR
jgi:hypothetical protein